MIGPLIVVLVALSTIVGWLGRNRAIGFFGVFTLSLLLTPFVMAFVLLVSEPRSKPLLTEGAPRSDD